MKHTLSPNARALWLAAACAVIFESVTALTLPGPAAPPLVYPFHYLNEPPSIDASIIQTKIEQLLFKNIPSVDILLVGDSSCLMGVSARTLEHITGHTVWNLGTLAFLSTEGHAEILDLYLRSHAKPRIIIYYISTYPLTSSREMIEYANYLEPLQLWLGIRSPHSRIQLPSYRLQHLLLWKLPQWSLRKSFLESARGPFPSDTEVRRLLWENHGSFTDPRHEDLGQVSFTPLKLSHDCVSGLIHLYNLADTHHVPLVIALNPIPHIADTPELNLDLEQLRRDLTELRSNATFTMLPPRFYALMEYATLNHLNAIGARKNSEELGRWIKELLGRSGTAG